MSASLLPDALAWRYGHVADTAGDQITAWRHSTEPQPSPSEIEQLLLDYRPVHDSRLQAEETAAVRQDAIAAIAKRQARITLAHNEAIRALYLAMPLTMRPDLPTWVRDTVQALHEIVINPDLRPSDEDPEP